MHDHTQESYGAVPSFGTVHKALQGSSNLWAGVLIKSQCVTRLKLKLLENIKYFATRLFLTLYKVILPIKQFVDEILRRGRSEKVLIAVLFVFHFFPKRNFCKTCQINSLFWQPEEAKG